MFVVLHWVSTFRFELFLPILQFKIQLLGKTLPCSPRRNWRWDRVDLSEYPLEDSEEVNRSIEDRYCLHLEPNGTFECIADKCEEITAVGMQIVDHP